MILIPTSKELKNYQPWGKSLIDLQKAHPDIKIFNSGTRETDNVTFKAGNWVKLKNGEDVKIIGFDKYDYPLPINKDDEPLFKYNNGPIQTTTYKTRHKKIVRAIHANWNGFCFTDLEEWEWLSKK